MGSEWHFLTQISGPFRGGAAVRWADAGCGGRLVFHGHYSEMPHEWEA